MNIDLSAVFSGERQAVARLISVVEAGGERARQVLATLYPSTGHAHIVGVTGAPGTGKSTLVFRLAEAFRALGLRVGIVAVDPSSPFTGGALLGDRVRMQELSCDPGVFIRSMASRGSLGGLAQATGDAVAVLDAAGYDAVLVETVGAGQVEVDIAQAAHTVVVVTMPGMGDDIQMSKAGILEIADVLVVNKADRENAERAVANLRLMVRLGHFTGDWTPPVLQTVATLGIGVTAVVDAVRGHYQRMQEGGGWEERLRRHARLRLVNAAEQIARNIILRRVGEARVEVLVRQVAARRIDPYAAAESLLKMAGVIASDHARAPLP